MIDSVSSVVDVVLFHHALGLTEGVQSLADRMRTAGHRVTVPDLFEGRRFDTLEDGVAHAESIGFQAVAEAGAAVIDGVGPPVATVGLSLGALPAQLAAQSSDRVRGVVLCDGALPPDAFGRWPANVPTQIHLGERDPWVDEDIDAGRALAAESDGRLHLYPTSTHLVIDSGLESHDAVIAEQIIDRMSDFLAGLSTD